MPASISSTFDIVINETLNSGGTASVVITNPGRTFRVVGVYVTGASGANFTLNKNTSVGTLVAQTVLATGDLNDFPCLLDGGPPIVPANLTFAATDNVFVREVAGNNVTRVVVVCEAGNPEALTVT